MPEGRREPFKETFLCLQKKKKERQETLKHTTKLVGWLAGWPGMHSCGRRAEELLGGSRPRGAPRPQALRLGGHRSAAELGPYGKLCLRGNREGTWGRDTWTPVLSTAALGWFWERGPPTVSEDTVHSAPALHVSITSPQLPKSPDPEWRLEAPLCSRVGGSGCGQDLPGSGGYGRARRLPPPAAWSCIQVPSPT